MGIRKRKSQISLEFMIVYSFVLIIFIVVFALITLQGSSSMAAESSTSLQLTTQNIASAIDRALASGNGFNITMPLAGSLLNAPYNLYISSTGVVFANMSIGTQSVNARAFSSARSLNINGSLLPSSTNTIKVYKVSTNIGTFSVANYYGTVYIDTPAPSTVNITNSMQDSVFNVKFGNFNGQTSYINVGTNGLPIGNSIRSVFAWVNWKGGTTQPAIFYYGTRASTYQDAGLYISSAGNVAFDGYTTYPASNLPLTTNSWHFVGYTYSGGSNVVVYQDSNTPQTLALSSALNTILPASDAADIGKQSNGFTGQQFPGSIANIQVYNSVLTSTQVSALYAAGYGGTPFSKSNLVAWWPLNYSTIDYSGSLNTGNAKNVTYTATTTVKLHNTFMDGSNGAGAKVGFISNAAKVNNTRVALAIAADSNGNATVVINSTFNSTKQKLFVNALNINKTLASNVISWLPLDAGYGNTIYDLSGNYNNGTFQSTSNWFSMPSNATNIRTASFSNNAQISATVPRISTAANSINTVTFWMNSTSANGIAPFGFHNYNLFIGSNCLGFNTTGNGIYGFNSVGLPNRWQFIAAEFFNGAYTANSLIYLNGTQKTLSQCTGTASTGTASTDVYVSGWGNSAKYYFTGNIANLQIYNASLTAAQVLQLYRQGISGVPLYNASLVLWLPLDGNTIDYSSSHVASASSNVLFKNYKYNRFNSTTSVANFTGTNAIYAAKVAFNSLAYNFSVNQWFMLKVQATNGVINGGQSPVVDIYNGITNNGIGGSQNFDFGGGWAGGTNKNFAWGAYWPTSLQFCSTPSGTIQTGVWYDALVAVKGYTNVTVYINGVNQKNCILAASLSTVASYGTNLMVGVGVNPTNTIQYGGVYVADVEVYKSTLTQAEAAQLYQQGLPSHDIVNVSLWST